MRGHCDMLSFFGALSDLLTAGFQLQTALESIAATSVRQNRTTASSLMTLMSEGYGFSAAVRQCGFFSFDTTLSLLFAAAEKTGSLQQVLHYVVQREAARKERRRQLMEAAFYPVLVVAAAAIGTVFLFSNFRSYSFTVLPAAAVSGCISACAFLLLYTLVFCMGCAAAFSESWMEQFFRAAGLLFVAGLDTAAVLRLIAGTESKKAARIAVGMLHLLENGVTFATAFREMCYRCPDDCLFFLEIGCTEGKLAETCSRLAIRLETEKKRIQQQMLRFAEPLMITGVGLYLLILLKNVALPFLTQFGNIL